MNTISIIVPVYKVEKYLDRCAESIVNQTYKNLEIILVDDGSPDNCPQMCDDWAKKDNRIKVIHKENGGVSSARNVGIDNATGKYIQFVDSDDYLELNACEVLLNNMKETNADLVVGDINRIGFTYKHDLINPFISSNQFFIFKELMRGYLFAHSCNKLYRTKLINKKFLIDRKYYEDFLFNCEYLFQCKLVSYINKIVYNYIAISDSAVHIFSEARFNDTCKAIDYIDNILKSRYGNDKYFENIEIGFLASSFINLVRTKVLSVSDKRKKLKSYTQNKNFIRIYKLKKDFKRTIYFFMLKYNFVRLLSVILKLKGV